MDRTTNIAVTRAPIAAHLRSSLPHSPSLKAKTADLSAADFLSLLSPSVAAISTLGSNPAASRGPYTCRKCEQRYPSLHALHSHYKSAHTSPGAEVAGSARSATPAPAAAAAAMAARVTAVKATAMKLARREAGRENHSNLIEALQARKRSAGCAPIAASTAETAAGVGAPLTGKQRGAKRSRGSCNEKVPRTSSYTVTPASCAGKRVARRFDALIEAVTVVADSAKVEPRVNCAADCAVESADDAAAALVELKAPIISETAASASPSRSSSAAPPSPVSIVSAVSASASAARSSAPSSAVPSLLCLPQLAVKPTNQARPVEMGPAVIKPRALRVTSSPSPATSAVTGTRTAAFPAHCPSPAQYPAPCPAQRPSPAQSGSPPQQYPSPAQCASPAQSLDSSSAPLALQLSAAADALRAAASATKPAGSAAGSASGGAEGAGEEGALRSTLIAVLLDRLSQLATLLPQNPAATAQMQKNEQQQQQHYQQQQQQQQQQMYVSQQPRLPQEQLSLHNNPPAQLAPAQPFLCASAFAENCGENCAENATEENFVREGSSSSAVYPSPRSTGDKGRESYRASRVDELDLELRL